MPCVCLERVVSDGCSSSGIKFKDELEDQLFSACQILSVCTSFVPIIFIMAVERVFPYISSSHMYKQNAVNLEFLDVLIFCKAKKIWPQLTCISIYKICFLICQTEINVHDDGHYFHPKESS